MKEKVVISVDYESPVATRVARDLWSALSRMALDSGLSGITARWESLSEEKLASKAEDSTFCIFVFGQDRPEAVERIDVLGAPEDLHPYGVVLATPEGPSPLAGSLLYQGVGKLTGRGVKAGTILPALIPLTPKTEGEAYAARLLENLRSTRRRR